MPGTPIAIAAPVAAALLAWAAAAPAQDAAEPNYNNPWAEGGYAPIPLPEVEGTVGWDTLRGVELVFDGPDMLPEYSAEVRALDGETIAMVGFMLPLDPSGSRVLLSQYAPHCPFCMTAGPESFVELECEEPIALGLDPIVVEGRFEAIDGAWNGYYYRMTDTVLVRRLEG